MFAGEEESDLLTVKFSFANPLLETWRASFWLPPFVFAFPHDVPHAWKRRWDPMDVVMPFLPIEHVVWLLELQCENYCHCQKKKRAVAWDEKAPSVVAFDESFHFEQDQTFVAWQPCCELYVLLWIPCAVPCNTLDCTCRRLSFMESDEQQSTLSYLTPRTKLPLTRVAGNVQLGRNHIHKLVKEGIVLLKILKECGGALMWRHGNCDYVVLLSSPT
jgi:hypothetical protein